MVGALLIAVGLCILLDSSYLLLVYRQPLSQAVSPLIALFNRQVLSWSVVSLGCAILLLSLLGCCGACVNNTCLLCLVSLPLVLFLPPASVLRGSIPTDTDKISVISNGPFRHDMKTWHEDMNGTELDTNMACRTKSEDCSREGVLHVQCPPI